LDGFLQTQPINAILPRRLFPVKPAQWTAAEGHGANHAVGM
jgi:hypothetical protein